MGRFIIKLGDYYLEWSSILDAPVTWGMDLDEFKKYYEDRHGNSSADQLKEQLKKRLKRVERNGTSAIGSLSVDDTISYNRAGYDESQLTKEEIYEWFCIKKQNPPKNIGKPHTYEDEDA